MSAREDLGCPALQARLRAAGIRPTAARIDVLQALDAEMPSPVRIEDLYRRMISQGAQASIRTARRVLCLLESKGVVQRAQDADCKAAYRLG